VPAVVNEDDLDEQLERLLDTRVTDWKRLDDAKKAITHCFDPVCEDQEECPECEPEGDVGERGGVVLFRLKHGDGRKRLCLVAWGRALSC
jgi:hypothetical protein